LRKIAIGFLISNLTFLIYDAIITMSYFYLGECFVWIKRIQSVLITDLPPFTVS